MSIECLTHIAWVVEGCKVCAAVRQWDQRFCTLAEENERLEAACATYRAALQLISHGHTISGWKGSDSNPLIALAQEVIHGAQTTAREALASDAGATAQRVLEAATRYKTAKTAYGAVPDRDAQWPTPTEVIKRRDELEAAQEELLKAVAAMEGKDEV